MYHSIHQSFKAILAALVLGACSVAEPSLVSWHSVDYPMDTGAPPRQLETWSDIGIVVAYASFNFLMRMDAYAYTLSPSLERPLCFIVMPYHWEVSVEDWDRLFAHERRHCMGQQHDSIIRDNKLINVWKP